MNARRKVTTKVYMDEIVERTGVAFLARGTHQPAHTAGGKSGAQDAARYEGITSKMAGDISQADIAGLHLILEADTANQVRQARAEVMMVINAECAKAHGSGVGGGPSVQGGRYQIV
jgi:hypothetical protein